METFILITIDGRNHLITKEQRDQIAKLFDGQAKAFTIGESLILLHQVSGIVPMEVYKRQMKQKLGAKGMKLCARCGTIVPFRDACPCKERPDRFPDILEVARKENPVLAEQLDRLADSKALPPPIDE